MTKLVFPLLAILGMAIFSCKNETPTPAKTAPPAEAAAPAASNVETVDYKITDGTVYWTATKANEKQHVGNFKTSGGVLKVGGGTVHGGNAVIDMKSLLVTDLEGKDKADLESHLKDSDFFEVNKFPTAEFVIDDVLPNKSIPDYPWVVTGTLTMKGKSQSINIPSKIIEKDGIVTVESPTFVINRTLWGINFHSGIIGTAKDKLIKDDVLMAIKLTATK